MDVSDTRALLSRITAFRERLERVTPLGPIAEPGRAAALAANPELLSRSLREIAGSAVNEGPALKLTTRARHLLEQARDLVAVQRRLTDDPLLQVRHDGVTTAGTDPLTTFHRSTVALTEAALRLVQALPDSAEVQLRLCAGVEAMFGTVRDRLGVTEYALSTKRTDAARVDRLSRLLTGLANGQSMPVDAYAELAEQILEDARRAVPLRFLSVDPTRPTPGVEDHPGVSGVARYVAGCSLTVAQVVARVVGHDYEWASRPLLPVMAALVMDVGMLKVTAEVLGKPGPLDAAERRQVDRHALTGAELIRRLVPDAGPLADAVAAHHERPDGTGYPDGLRGEAIPSLSRMLAACSEYAAMASDRPHRPAHDPRAALTESLLAAEQGRLDRDFAEYLLNLSFHPVGTVVELTDGRAAVVVATHNSRTNLRATSRPVVAVLTDPSGAFLPRPEFVDLAAADHGGVVRALTSAERRTLLSERYPDLC